MHGLLIGAFLLAGTAASADVGVAPAQSDWTCPDEMKAEVLHNLWKRQPVARPGRDAATLRVTYRNEYGSPPEALLIALDGATTYLRCAAPQSRGEVFTGPLAPGVHHVDAVYNFGPGRVGRTPYTFRMKSGSDLSITVVLDRDEHEHPTASMESTRGNPEQRPMNEPAPPAERERQRAKEEKARRECVENCQRRRRNTDCADSDGNMMPCPCHCE